MVNDVKGVPVTVLVNTGSLVLLIQLEKHDTVWNSLAFLH